MVMAGMADQVAFRTGTLKVDVRKAPRVEVISLIDVLDGKIDRARFAGKVVVFGYEGAKSDMFDTPAGRLSAHRAFLTNLLAIEAGAFELK
jgi:CHASE2 domain-containing sensor protein